MPKGPQMVLFNVEEVWSSESKWLSSSLSLGSNPETPKLKFIAAVVYSYHFCFNHYPQVVVTGESRDVDQPYFHNLAALLCSAL